LSKALALVAPPMKAHALPSSATDIFLNIDVLCTVSSSCIRRRTRLADCRVLDVVNKEQTPLRLVNRTGVSIHHVANHAAIWRSAFIFDEGQSRMVNRAFASRRACPHNSS
jgi:hypothetical protein